MFKKIKGEFKKIKWPNKWVLFENLAVVFVGSIGLILIISSVELLSKFVFSLTF